MRYINLSITETFRMMSSPVMKRFPTYQHLIDAGLMTPNEVLLKFIIVDRTDPCMNSDYNVSFVKLILLFY